MTRSSPRDTGRQWNGQKWLGRLLGCVVMKRGASSSSGSDIYLPASRPRSSDLSCSKSLKAKEKRQNVVLLTARGTTGEHKPLPLPVPATTPVSTMFGELEMALYSEGLLEYRDPQATVPVLSIGYGFTDEELRALSKPLTASSKVSWTSDLDDHWHCGLGFDQLLCGMQRKSTEPMIDGLPASVWLECVEPTLSILISLNSLRHRRSNLSVKKGLPSTLDSNRSRHGDFELGPIAVLHHPGHIQQMMLLRVEFLNAAAGSLHNHANNVYQLADQEHNGRRGNNRHRRFRQVQHDELDGENATNNNASDNNNNNYNCNSSTTFNYMNQNMTLNNVVPNTNSDVSLIAHSRDRTVLSTSARESEGTHWTKDCPADLFPRSRPGILTPKLSTSYTGIKETEDASWCPEDFVFSTQWIHSILLQSSPCLGEELSTGKVHAPHTQCIKHGSIASSAMAKTDHQQVLSERLHLSENSGQYLEAFNDEKCVSNVPPGDELYVGELTSTPLIAGQRSLWCHHKCALRQREVLGTSTADSRHDAHLSNDSLQMVVGDLVRRTSVIPVEVARCSKDYMAQCASEQPTYPPQDNDSCRLLDSAAAAAAAPEIIHDRPRSQFHPASALSPCYGSLHSGPPSDQHDWNCNARPMTVAVKPTSTCAIDSLVRASSSVMVGACMSAAAAAGPVGSSEAAANRGNERAEEGNEDGGDHVMAQLVPVQRGASLFPHPPAYTNIPHLLPPIPLPPLPTATAWTSTRASHVRTTTSQPLDVLAQGDHVIPRYSFLPAAHHRTSCFHRSLNSGEDVCGCFAEGQAEDAGIVDPRTVHTPTEDTQAGSYHRGHQSTTRWRLRSRSRDLVRRAHGAWSRWRLWLGFGSR